MQDINRMPAKLFKAGKTGVINNITLTQKQGLRSSHLKRTPVEDHRRRIPKNHTRTSDKVCDSI